MNFENANLVLILRSLRSAAQGGVSKDESDSAPPQPFETVPLASLRAPPQDERGGSERRRVKRGYLRFASSGKPS
ncbi:hypothetical protein BK204_16210 [Brucella melitensis]|nr:hypothetical protein BK218_16205 [Brucella melitensis]ARY17359.1 hypothetical protein BK163_16195 [Brucella melitensis]ARY23700.1 hypothetical protein BK191_16205 [Brucella melitensis]ARY83860.1 hypothetical protein BK192_16200 [Brucella melitensis]ARZ06026.1 hypothetical protein BK152_16200 [Brucella melitensis]